MEKQLLVKSFITAYLVIVVIALQKQEEDVINDVFKNWELSNTCHKLNKKLQDIKLIRINLQCEIEREKRSFFMRKVRKILGLNKICLYDYERFYGRIGNIQQRETPLFKKFDIHEDWLSKAIYYEYTTHCQPNTLIQIEMKSTTINQLKLGKTDCGKKLISKTGNLNLEATWEMEGTSNYRGITYFIPMVSESKIVSYENINLGFTSFSKKYVIKIPFNKCIKLSNYKVNIENSIDRNLKSMIIDGFETFYLSLSWIKVNN